MNQNLATLEKSDEHFADGITIPPCPTMLTKLLREARAEEPDFRRLGQLITGDVGLAAAVLNVANSSFYALRTKVNSVHQAVAMLGVDAVIQLVTGLLLRQAFPTISGHGIEHYWRRSTACALIAALVAREARRSTPEIAHTYVLFRDCGMPVLQQKYGNYADILDGSALAAGTSAVVLETQRYGTNHCRIGAWLARGWGLSDGLVQAILSHHDIPPATDAVLSAEAQALIALGLASEHIYCSTTQEDTDPWEPVAQWAMPLLGLDGERLTGLCERIGPSLT